MTANRLAMRLLLPLLLLNVTVSNQAWQIGPVYVSQFLLFWPAILCASIIVTTAFGRRSIWPPLIIGAVIVSRALGANSATGVRYLTYAAPLNALFVLAASIIALRTRERMFRQLRLYFALSVPFMFLQVAGAGSWTLALNTETTAVGDQRIETARISYPMLFAQPEGGMPFTIGQTRPAGFMHANNVLSLAIMFAVAVQFSRIRFRRISGVDVLLCAAVVLAMAKIVVLSLVVMVVWRFASGSSMIRARVRRIVLVTALCYGAYAVLFPALFDYHVNPYRLAYSVFVRLNPIVSRLDPDGAVAQFVAPYLIDTPTLGYLAEDEVVSGFEVLVARRAWLYAGGLLMVVAWFPMRRAFRAMRRWSPERADLAMLALIVTVLFPAAVPTFGMPLYSFIVGVALMPIVWHNVRHVRNLVTPSRDEDTAVPSRSMAWDDARMNEGAP